MADNEKKSKKGKGLLLVILIILAIGGGTFGGAYFVMMNKNAENQPVYMKETYYEVGEIFVNLSDENANRYVKLKLTISYDSENKNLGTELTDKAVVIKDVANFYFKSLKAKDFEPANEAVLKGDLIKRVNQKLTSGTLQDVYISEILVQ
jgi:flagellar protein FliL